MLRDVGGEVHRESGGENETDHGDGVHVDAHDAHGAEDAEVDGGDRKADPCDRLEKKVIFQGLPFFFN